MRRPPIDPVVWRPSKVERRPVKDTLPPLTVLQVNGFGTEDVLVDKGHVFTGVDDGRILRLTPDGRRLDTIADTGGRPLGLELHPDGRLVVCDSDRGLLLVDRTSGQVEVLLGRDSNTDLRVCNNAAVAADGTIYFTDSTTRFDLEYWRADLFEHRGTGRLLRRSPDGTVDVLHEGLHFANGVALSADESFVVVAQTGAYQLDRVWLTGDRPPEMFVGGLPGFPDNLATGSDGLIWIAMASPRVPAFDILSRLHPALRKAAWAVPQQLQPKEKKVVWVRAVDESGKIVHDFYGTHPRFHLVTGVREAEGTVYLGSLQERAIAYFDLP